MKRPPVPIGILPATAYVVAQNAPEATIESARVLKMLYGDLIQICDGTADNVEIQAAIDSMTAGKIMLSEGTFNIAAQLTINGKAINLEGAGTMATQLRQAYNGTVLNLTGTMTFPRIANLNIFGVKATYALGLGITVTDVNVYDLQLENLFIWYFKQGGLSVTGGWGHNYLNVISEYNDGAQMRIGSNTKIQGCKCGGNSNAADPPLLVMQDANIVTACEFFAHNGTNGANMPILILAGYNIIQGNSFFNMNSGAAGMRVITLGTAGNIVTGNHFYSVTSSYGIQEIVGASNSVIVGNSYDGCTWWSGNFVTLYAGSRVIAHSNGLQIVPGEIRNERGSLTAGAANAIGFAWHNPHAQRVLIRKVVIEVTTAGGTVGSHLDVGIADDAAGTNRGIEFFDDLDLNAAQVNDSWVAGDGGTQGKWVLCQYSAFATDSWVVGQILDANAANLVGSYYIEYEGR